ncbi:MAG TPA: insulinase family protein [Parvularculaceae bacterium]|nr:insulinase family protein [Parvularculaceae bacterium]
MFSILIAAALSLCIPTVASARLDLSNASVERLDTGLTLIMLEDRTFPVVSVHMSYRTGAKDDPAGRLGLAHFFEHMAFRGSKNFPDLGLTSEIYAVGGEWHGYTWIDNTNYFATVPKNDLPLLIDIEADRMARLELRKEDIEAERGAVLAEMNGYANDPDSTLFDALMAAHFLTHPYRNNTIGYASDIAAIAHEDVVDFYERHYAPQNAILAIVGDIDRDTVRALVKKKFGKIRKKIRPRAPLTAEIPRTGERRVTISLPSDEKLFKIAYPAPAASHSDFPAFLVLQALIGESAGVNFNQNDWGTPVGADSPIASAADGVRTWIIPTAEAYAFVVSGSAAAKLNDATVENAIQSAFDKIAKTAPAVSALDAAKRKLIDALAFDVDTTEEAAHQLAYFAGVGAFDQLLTLEDAVRKATAEDIRAIASKYLAKNQRTIAWLEPGSNSKPQAIATAKELRERKGAFDNSSAAAAPISIDDRRRPLIHYVRSGLSNTVAIKFLVAGRFECDACAVDDIAFGTTTVAASAPSDGFAAAFKAVASAIDSASPLEMKVDSDEPLAKLEQYFASLASIERKGPNIPRTNFSPYVYLVAISGDIEAAAVQDALRENFQEREGGITIDFTGNRPLLPTEDVALSIDRPLAQEAVGFIAEMPDSTGGAATRIALYALSHGYSGRLGDEAISRRGLAYYIDARYRYLSGAGFVTLTAGVDPDKVDAFRDLMKAEIARLKTEPPTDAEIDEAKRHLLGRKISAAQSNEEIAEAMLKDFLAVGRPESAEEFAERLSKVTRQDVLNAIETLQKGAVVTVRGAGVD